LAKSKELEFLSSKEWWNLVCQDQLSSSALQFPGLGVPCSGNMTLTKNKEQILALLWNEEQIFPLGHPTENFFSSKR
jgi:hypothetical protein